jgi:hypothetical protein
MYCFFLFLQNWIQQFEVPKFKIMSEVLETPAKNNKNASRNFFHMFFYFYSFDLLVE